MVSEEIKKLLFAALEKLDWSTEISLEQIELEHPANPDHGDYAANLALVLAKKIKKPPMAIAQALVDKLNSLADPKLPIAKIEAAPPGFINFWLAQEYLVRQAIELLDKKQFRQRLAKIGQGRTIIIDYSSPNIARPFGIGHLRSTNIGQAIYNLYQFLGWQAIGDNHLGDWGTQFGKLIYMIKTKNLKPETLTIQDLERLYVEFHQSAEQNPELEEAGRQWFKKLEAGDPEAKRIWQACVDLSLKEFNRIYRLLGIKIDYAYGESYYHFHGWMDQVLDDAKKCGLLKKSQGALVVDLPELSVPAMLVKSDGATTYLLRDLAAIKFRVQKWQPDLIVYEVGAEQKLHFQQVFLVAEKLGYIKKEKLVHLGHGLIRWPEGKFSTRKGRTIHLESVIEEGIKRARELVDQSQTSQDLTEQEKGEIAQAVAIGGIKFNDLKQEIQRDILFDWDKILALEGYSAPYLQYTYARCASVLRKAAKASVADARAHPEASGWSWRGEEVLNAEALEKVQLPAEINPEEQALLRLYYQFHEVLVKAADEFAPHLLCQYLFDLAQKFNLFYQKHRILSSEKTEQSQLSIANFRLLLAATTAQILKTGLNLLGIEVLEKM